MKRKNFLPTAVATVIFWAALGIWILETPPEGPVAIGGFFFLFFWSLWLPLSVVFSNSRRGFLVAIGALGSLVLKPLGMSSLLSLAAWWSIILLLEIWRSSQS